MLYRRWKTRDDLLRATARHRGAADPPAIPDTGTLRGDLLALLAAANSTRNPMAALVSSMLTPRIVDLPFDLSRNEMLMTLKPVPDHVLRQIVDDIFIPLPARV